MNSSEISYKKPLLETPFHKRTSEHCYSNDWYRWAGYKVAKEYSSTELEYTSMRNTAGRRVLENGESARIGWGSESLVILEKA